ncbi:LOW QUALITY PROTEIN: killin [Hippopotamus amphibius kiboko]|uniref:LOW QUALITY PROTEIN: killin n=1 Tax=Hippopotamus amphibius kiboko TaxID=575201 RepID=UPI0025926F63|nr:LOW QUALITY PROTEIN: killin [Hippopotamus amphibius kiboko]
MLQTRGAEKHGSVGSCSPCEWASRGDLGGFKRRWRDTQATVGTTFRRRSRVFLVGELSKFPLPSDSSRGKCFASFAPGAPARYGQRDPRASRVSAEEQAQTSLPPQRCRDWRPRNWLHKHPRPSTCPRLPSPWLPPLILADLGARVPKLVTPSACYPQSKLGDGERRLRALDPLALCLPSRGRKGWAPGVCRIFLASALPLRAKLSGAVLAA